MSIVVATSIIVIIFLVVVSLIKTNSYFEGYDKTVNPTAASAFTTSAFRFLFQIIFVIFPFLISGTTTSRFRFLLNFDFASSFLSSF